MLSRRPYRETVDPDASMSGTCRTCQTLVVADRGECRWHDQLKRMVAECPACRESSPAKVGTAVIMQPVDPYPNNALPEGDYRKLENK